jgi:ribosomal protein L7/L12
MSMYLTDAIDHYKAEKNPTIKRAMLVVCNALYRDAMGFSPKKHEVCTTPNADEVYTGRYTSKVQMIQAHRTRTGLGLIESKRICEDYFGQMGLEFNY